MAWAPAYVTTADLKSYLRIGDTGDDAQLDLAIEAASRAIDRATNRQFGAVAATEERRYTAAYDRRRRRWVVEVDDVMNATMTVTGDAGEIDGYDLEPINAAQLGRPWTHVAVRSDSAVQPTDTEHGVTVDAVWGWSAVPAAIEQACLLQASRIHARRTSPYGVAGSPELGSELRLLARVDADVAVTVGPYTRWWAAV
jgi:uncharacterized phiE125 gp8 family phage protein